MKSWKKWIAGITCAAVVCGTVGMAAYMAEETKAKGETKQETSSKAAEQTAHATAKEETVYVLLDAEGATKQVIVSGMLQNGTESSILTDTAGLSEVTNVKGDETYTVNGNEYAWNADGKDIYYQGNSEKEAPVAISIRYTLDGKEVSSAELLGKSGLVTITMTYTSTQTEKVEVNGRTEEVPVPFVAITGVLLDNEHFKNIRVTNGRAVSDGARTAVVGFALPGVADALSLEEELAIPSVVEITAQVSEFTLGETFTVATNELFAGINVEQSGGLDQISASLESLGDAAEKLTDGSMSLYAGLTTLQEKTGELRNGVDALADGSDKLLQGADSAAAGAESLKEGSVAVAEGLKQLTANNDTLNEGARQVFASLLATADNALAQAGMEVPALEIDTYAAVLDGVIASLQKMQAAGENPQLEAAKAQLQGLKAQLDSYNAFYQGLTAYTAGVAQAEAGAGQVAAGSSKLAEGTNALKQGSAALKEGVSALQSGSAALTEGIALLQAGAKELADGMETFQAEGIDRLLEAFDGTLSELASRLTAMGSAAKAYTGFSGQTEGVSGSVKFIYKTDAIQ